MARYDVFLIDKLAEHFERLPGIGRKTAHRLAYSVLNMSEEQVADFAQSLIEAKKNVHYCKVCSNFTDKEICSICSDKSRDSSIICVVEEPKDVGAFEKSKEFRPLYHVLHGTISPLNGIGPDQLCIKGLLARIASGEVKEVFMALNPSVEGEATAIYISKLIKPHGVKVTHLAYGIPFGATLEYTDSETLGRAISGRIEF